MCTCIWEALDLISWYNYAPYSHYIDVLQGWLVDLVNKFGTLGGFSILQERICGGDNLSVPLLAALLRFVIMFLFTLIF